MSELKITDEIDENSGERVKASEVFPYTLNVANGHEASICSIMGEHTVGFNSDTYYLKEDVNGVLKYPELLCMVADGVSGNKQSQNLLGGKFASNYFSVAISRIWNEEDVIGSFKFDDTTVLEQLDGKSNASFAFNCIIKKLIETGDGNGQYLFEALSMGKNLLLKQEILKKDLSGQSAAQIAEIILIDEEIRKPIIKFLFSIYKAISRFKKQMEDKFFHQIDIEEDLQSLTTLTGVMETENFYILFGIGDSRSYLVSEDGTQFETVTDKHSINHALTSCLGGQISLYTAMTILPSYRGISFKVLNKKDLKLADQIVCETDGFGVEDVDILRQGEIIGRQKGQTHVALTEVLGDLLAREKSYKKSLGRRFLPDDKTMIILKKKS